VASLKATLAKESKATSDLQSRLDSFLVSLSSGSKK